MSRKLTLMVAVAALWAAPVPLAAQELYSFTATALGGLGGSVDADRGDGVDNPGFQVGFSIVTEPRTLVGLRVGRITFDDSQPLESLLDAEMTYAILAGEYRFDQGYYESGVYVGIGGYRLEGTPLGGADPEDTAVGLAVGFTGEFAITRRFGLAIELSGHYADLQETQMFAMGHGGLAFHF